MSFGSTLRSSLELSFLDSVTGPNAPKQFHVIPPTSIGPEFDMNSKPPQSTVGQREQMCKLEYILIAVMSLKVSTPYPPTVSFWEAGR